MSLLTRCSACDTLFRVVPDQLRISEGWVKCGQCGDIFDGYQQLIEFDEAIASVNVATTEAASVEIYSELLPKTVAQEPFSTVSKPVECVGAMGCHQNISDNLGMAAQKLTPEDEGSNLFATGHVSMVIETEQLSKETLDSPALESTSLELSTNDAQVADPCHEIPQVIGFLKENAQPSQHTWLNKAAWVGVVLFVLLLVGQWTWAFRQQLVAIYPQFEPVMHSFAALTGSTMQPLQQIESLTVDSVSFHQVDSETYQLNFVVKNNAVFSLAQPWLELALTDAQDQAVYRRVFSPKELGVENSMIDAKVQWISGVTLKVEQTTQSPALLGYKLLVFYP